MELVGRIGRVETLGFVVKVSTVSDTCFIEQGMQNALMMRVSGQDS